jgi:hypothetical protein
MFSYYSVGSNKAAKSQKQTPGFLIYNFHIGDMKKCTFLTSFPLPSSQAQEAKVRQMER